MALIPLAIRDYDPPELKTRCDRCSGPNTEHRADGSCEWCGAITLLIQAERRITCSPTYRGDPRLISQLMAPDRWR